MSIPKYVLYSRQSKVNGNSNQMTLETSEFAMTNYLDTLGVEGVDYEIVEVLREIKSSYGKNSTNRKNFNRAVELCKEYNAKLLVSTMSRLSRNTALGARILEEVDVVVATSPTADKAMKQIMLIMAENESDQQSQRRKATYQAKKKRCEEAGEELVWGARSSKYKETHQRNKEAGLHKQSKVRTPQNPALINRIKQMHSDSNGSMTQTEMANRLNAEGYKTSRGNKVVQGTVSAIIKKYC